ncbi:four helix bundle protein [bacterium]|jgi:four helix bundle protein|nr:four helix bundle protein [bacterium]MBT6832194.1 four helix bundle protein [bacterium]MBT6996139.1 four helix bundle protein [bacterium]MBT7772219.1 four helix bundle protein [bacterium]
MQNYKDLQVWQKAFDLSVQIYEKTKQFPPDERFGLVSQMRRAAVSIVSNIAEGHGRSTNKEFSYFLKISIGSCNELETQIFLSQKLKYIHEPASISLQNNCNEVIKMLHGLLKKL